MDAPKKLSWSDDEIARFWDYWAGQSDSQETYFALQVGEGVSRFAEDVRPLSGLQILDFGSGPGHLIPHLLERGATVSAVDHSPDSVAEVDQRFLKTEGWETARVFGSDGLPWDANAFDAVFCLETIEHLHAEDCDRIFDEIQRVLRPSGFLVVTTPNEENLARQQVYCPGCNSQFHRWQHLRSWSHQQLRDSLEAHGYVVPFCGGLDFRSFQPSSQRRIRFSAIKRYLRSRFLDALDDLFPRPFPNGRHFQWRIRRTDGHHLAAVAIKPDAAHPDADDVLRSIAA